MGRPDLRGWGGQDGKGAPPGCDLGWVWDEARGHGVKCGKNDSFVVVGILIIIVNY